MIRLLLPLLLLSSPELSGQDAFLQVLSREVCSCLDGKTSEAVAQDCLEALTVSQAKTIRKRYDLDASIPAQRDQLTELMLDYLLSECPLLKTIRIKSEENEFRWADGQRNDEASVQQFTARKGPPADTSGTFTSEPPSVWRASGTLLAQPGSKGLRLLTVEKKELSFELPSSVARRRDFDPGDEISLTYRREWRPGEDRVVLVVTGID